MNDEEMFKDLVGKRIKRIRTIKNISEQEKNDFIALAGACSDDVEIQLENGTIITGIIF